MSIDTVGPVTNRAFHRVATLIVLMIAMLAISGFVGGCTVYDTPSGTPVNFGELGIGVPEVSRLSSDRDDPSGLTSGLPDRPLADFPAVLAVARVQGQGYISAVGPSYHTAGFSIVGGREAESDRSIRRLESLPLVLGVAPLNRLVVDANARNEEDLRRAAARVQADLLLLYTFDTRSSVETTIPLLGLATLGLFPTEEARVRTTAAAVLIDTRSGYVFGIAEATHTEKQPANEWTSGDAVSQAWRRAERRAFDDLVDQFEVLWDRVVQGRGAYGTR